MSVLVVAAVNESHLVESAEYLPDSAVDARDDQALRSLFTQCFVNGAHNQIFHAQRFFREMPAHRWVVRDPSGLIVAHAACHEKRVGTGAGDISVAGVAEVATHPAWRRRGLALRALTTLQRWAESRFEFALLFGVNPIYDKLGYATVERSVRLLGLDDASWRIERRPLRVLSFSGRPLPEGIIDLRCPLF